MFYVSEAKGVEIHESDFEEHSVMTHTSFFSGKILCVLMSGTVILADSNISCEETSPCENEDVQAEYCTRALIAFIVQEMIFQNTSVKNSCSSIDKLGFKF